MANAEADQNEIDVRGFIQARYQPYEGTGTFLAGPSAKTLKLMERVETLMAEEHQNQGVWDIDTHRVSGILHFEPGYIDRDSEVIVGLQTDAPLKRMVNPYGGIKMAKEACTAYGKPLSESISDVFTNFRKTHNQGVFDIYTDEMKRIRKAGLITGLPDAYGRGRIIGDFRRVALYGVDRLMESKKHELNNAFAHPLNLLDLSSEEVIRLREEISEQIRALKALKDMAATYAVDLSKPAETAKEAVQAVYMAYLAAVKESNGAAMSLGRVSTFLDCYIEQDLNKGLITEIEAQELIDQFVLKLRLVRHLRTPEYNSLFAGDPNWVTESLGGMGEDGRPLVTKTTFRFLHTLINLKSAPEPNMTILWSERLPSAFKHYCAELSARTGALQYENDDLMRPLHGDDYAIACCVSAMTLGKQMQYFGARCNLTKVMLYAINGGRDERTGEQVLEIPGLMSLEETGQPLDFDWVWSRMTQVMDHVAKLYIQTLNGIHYMHDKYAYESVLMALHDGHVERLMACGIAGLSVVADSLSAIRHACVRPVFQGDLVVDYVLEGDYPQYGNDDDRVDELAILLVKTFNQALQNQKPYRKAIPTLSVLTITSNVIYGKKTGATPDGRKSGEPFAPGANPMHGRETHGALASLNTVAKLDYTKFCRDGISNTFTISPQALGGNLIEQSDNLVAILNGYFMQGAHHLNVNVLDRQTLIEAMAFPERYPNLTLRVSGYAVHFHKLTKEQQLEILARTFHELA